MQTTNLSSFIVPFLLFPLINDVSLQKYDTFFQCLINAPNRKLSYSYATLSSTLHHKKTKQNKTKPFYSTHYNFHFLHPLLDHVSVICYYSKRQTKHAKAQRNYWIILTTLFSFFILVEVVNKLLQIVFVFFFVFSIFFISWKKQSYSVLKQGRWIQS